MNFEFLSTFHLFMLKAENTPGPKTEKNNNNIELPTDSIHQILFLLFKDEERNTGKKRTFWIIV